jgi:hypothetical protein
MKKIWGIFFISALCTVTAFGQKNNIEVKSFKIDPNPVKLGNTITATVEFTGKQKKLKSVELYSREYGYDAPQMRLIPDKNKKLNIWTFEFQIPYEIPAGTYTMELKAVTKKDVQIESKTCNNCVYGKTAEIKVTVIN